MPLFLDTLKESVWIVILATLKLDHPLGVLPHEEPDHVPGTTVVRPVQVSLLVRQLMVPQHEVCKTLLVQSTDRL